MERSGKGSKAVASIEESRHRPSTIKWEFGLGERALAAGEESGAGKITIPVVDSGARAG